ncbi:RHS repeat domain-containing protein [Chitinophaga sp.]|uniref:RHS repeat domain-containing protein n=1 Tax=Chitinophaga sp. TaxID=1869181 RepID=UPI0031DC4F0F
MTRLNLAAILFFSFFSLVHSSFAQEKFRENVIAPPSTNAASLARYIDYPVTMNNGLPSISIPLYELRSTRITIPISISYHAGGIRVTDRTSTMGLGWALNAGGSIVRTINGLPDDSRYGFLNMVFPDESRPNVQYKEACLANYIYNRYTPEASRDGQPDTYFYSFPGGGGKFMFKNVIYPGFNPEAVVIPFAPVKVDYKGGSGLQAAPFVITDTDGTTYEFGKDTRASIDPGGSGYSNATDYSITPTAPTEIRSVTAAWHLTKIISADRSDTVLFRYKDWVDAFSSTRISTSILMDYGTIDIPTMRPIPQMKLGSTSKTEYSARLTEISSKTGRVVFNYGPDSQPALQTVVVYNAKGEQLKSISLTTSLFNSSVSNAPNRLRLDRVQETGYYGGQTIVSAPYDFVYNTTDVPPYNSNSQDLWGFYNGYTTNAENDNLLIVNKIYDPTAPPGMQYSLKLIPEKRLANPLYMSKAMLKKITYPTGGSAEFTFEPNQTQAMVPVLIPGTPTSGFNISTMYMYPGGGSSGADITFKPSANGNGTGVLTFSGSKVCSPGSGNCVYQQPQVELFDVTAGQSILFYTLSALESGQQSSESFTRTLYNIDLTHTYRLRFPNAGSLTNDNQTLMYRLSATYSDAPQDRYEDRLQTVYTGGHRVKSIVQREGIDSTLIKSYNYTKAYFNSIAFNGKLDFIERNTKQDNQAYGTGVALEGPPVRKTSTYSEFPSISIGGASNSSLSYEEVEEVLKAPDGRELGKTVYTFNKVFDEIPPRLPFIRLDREYARKQLLNTKIYGIVNNQPVLQREIRNIYNNANDIGFDGPVKDSIKFYIVTTDYDFRSRIEGGGTVTYPEGSDWPKSFGCRVFAAGIDFRIDPQYYHVYSSTLTSKKDITYTNTGDSMVVETQYSYGNPLHLLPTKVTSVSSQLETKEQFFTRPLDIKYQSCQPSTCLATFNQQILLLRTTQETCEQNALNAQSLDAYDLCQKAYDDAVKLKIQEYNTCEAQYQQSHVNCRNSLSEKERAIVTMQDNNQVTPELENSSFLDGKLVEKGITDYQIVNPGIIRSVEVFRQIGDAPIESLEQYKRFDLAGNLLQRRKTNNIDEIYIWGYDNRYPVAKVVGATYDAAMAILNPAILQAPANDQQMRNELNKLRTQFPQAQVTSYTYADLIGATSETDPSGRTSFYEYDALGRLKVVRDYAGRIIKQYDYQYRKPVIE